MSTGRKNLGKLGEDLACGYLKKRGYRILARNFFSRRGEIDIVAQEADCLAFVEVKTRFSDSYGLPEEAVTPKKIESILRTGEFYQFLNPESPESLRIDVVAVEFDNDGRLKRMELLKNVTG
ncbi:MAG: YraN family protein [Patescibacteria group bacterium]|nr:YraN family protein [Patescibacteria group bacterium]